MTGVQTCALPIYLPGGLSRDGWSLAIAAKVLTRRLLRRGTRYGSKLEHMRHNGRALAIAPQGLYTQTSALGNAL